MAREYQNRLTEMLEELDIRRSSDVELQVKPFFGGAAAYADGHICLSLTKVGFAIKLPQSDRQELMKSGAQPLRYFPNAPIKKKYVLLPTNILNDKERLRHWITKCITYVTTAEGDG